MSRCFLKVGSFNVSGNLFDKLCRIKELQELIKSFDIFVVKKVGLLKSNHCLLKGTKYLKVIVLNTRPLDVPQEAL